MLWLRGPSQCKTTFNECWEKTKLTWMSCRRQRNYVSFLCCLTQLAVGVFSGHRDRNSALEKILAANVQNMLRLCFLCLLVCPLASGLSINNPSVVIDIGKTESCAKWALPTPVKSGITSASQLGYCNSNGWSRQHDLNNLQVDCSLYHKLWLRLDHWNWRGCCLGIGTDPHQRFWRQAHTVLGLRRRCMLLWQWGLHTDTTIVNYCFMLLLFSGLIRKLWHQRWLVYALQPVKNAKIWHRWAHALFPLVGFELVITLHSQHLSSLYVLPPPASHFVTGDGTSGGANVSIASWNIRNVSRNSRSNAELGIIAYLMSRYDFLALQVNCLVWYK